MKNTTKLLFLFFCIISATIYSQSLQESELIGDWVVTNMEITYKDDGTENDKSSLEYLGNLYKESTFIFKSDYSFTLYNILTAIEDDRNSMKWDYDSENSLILISGIFDGVDSSSLSMPIKVEMINEKIVFKMTGTPFAFEVKKKEAPKNTKSIQSGLLTLNDISNIPSTTKTTNTPAKPNKNTYKNWVLVMAKGVGFKNQSYFKRSYFPKEKIQEEWDEGKAITSLTYTNGEWLVVLSKDSNLYSQTCEVYNKFPSVAIEEGWDNGRHITSLNYADDVWALVMSKGSNLTSQSWATRDEFPKDYIKKHWDEDKYISSLNYGNGKWAVVMSEGTGYTNQRWRTRKEFPRDEIQKGWDDGYSITSLSYGNGLWALVMSEGTGYYNQRWNTKSTFPSDKIQEGWDDDLLILSVNVGN